MPSRSWGADCIDRFGPRLPFLLKVLAPGRAISIQAHPTAEQACAERARTRDAVYVDDWAKPELLLALAPFEVFVGMRSFVEVVELARR
jgi:mannose-6-phosphate isomerase